MEITFEYRNSHNENGESEIWYTNKSKEFNFTKYEGKITFEPHEIGGTLYRKSDYLEFYITKTKIEGIRIGNLTEELDKFSEFDSLCKMMVIL